MDEYGRARQATDDSIIRRMRSTCWITKATDTHSGYVILFHFPPLQWLRETASNPRILMKLDIEIISKICREN